MLEELRERATRRSNRIWEQLGRSQAELEPPAAAYRRLRLQMLSAERSSILEARDRGVYDDEVLRTALSAIDLEESLLDRVEDAAARVDDELDHRRRARRRLRAPARRAAGRDGARRPTGARSACATAPAGCTCGCA